MAQDDDLRIPGFRPPSPSPSPSPSSDPRPLAPLEGRAEEVGAEQADDPRTDDVRARDVRRRIVLEASPDEVWRALTDPDELATWWGEGSHLDATPGGEGRFEEDDQPTRLARVVEARPGKRLVLDWWPEDPDVDEPATRVTIELEPCPFGTVVTILECVLLDLSELPVLVAPRPTFLPPSWRTGPLARALVGV